MVPTAGGVGRAVPDDAVAASEGDALGSDRVLTGGSARGRRFRRKLRDNAQARRQALESIAPGPNGTWQARVGGPVRGTLRTYLSRDEAERDVNAHYTTLVHRWVMQAAKEGE
jgi:hypothetical protein